MTEPANPTEGPAFEALLNQAQGGDPEARYQLGRCYVEAADFGRARRWFGRAGRSGHGDALLELGRLELRGLGIPASLSDAVGHFQEAAQLGSVGAHAELAPLTYRGDGMEASPTNAIQHLLAAARSGDTISQRCCAFLFAESGDAETATRCLELAARGGDAIAQNALAQRLSQGIGCAPDRVAAGYWSARAIESGSYCQAEFHEALADASAEEPDSTALSAAAIPDITLGEIAPLESEDPVDGQPVKIYPAVYTQEECEYLIESAAPFLLPSYTLDPKTGKPLKTDHRTSHSWSFHPTQEDLVILRLKERLTRQTGMSVKFAEPFSMLRYQNGQEYKRHFDWIDPATGEGRWEIERHGQRKTTIFSYLTDVEAGGETHFPRLDLKIAPRQGKAVQFANEIEDGRVYAESLHASLPVERGEKWLATLWIRERPMEF